MASALEADLNQLKLVFAVGQRFDPAIRTDEIHAEITTRLREELDYRREARHVASTATCCATSPTCMCLRSWPRIRPTGCSP